VRRFLAALFVLLCLSPGLVWRDLPLGGHSPQPLRIRPLQLGPATLLAPGVTVAGAWQLSSASPSFGGYSSLIVLPEGELLALSDRGQFLRFGMPTQLPMSAVSGPIAEANDSDKWLFDVEAATRDPASGAIWLAYEGSNTIRRYGSELGSWQAVQPEEMRGWPTNRGPEAMVRLTDGRFIVLSEALADGPPPSAQGLLFPADPVDGAAPERFQFVPPDGFRPTDMAQLPDGRVVILLRRFRVGFSRWLASRLVLADPATIAAGDSWDWEPLAEIRSPVPLENYEGIAVEPRDGGAVRLWIISDDNSAALQRTLLLALDWKP